jgi:hypothetical protein
VLSRGEGRSSKKKQPSYALGEGVAKGSSSGKIVVLNKNIGRRPEVKKRILRARLGEGSQFV